jgi:drug/metabolite transporter (DMT)-like permease
MVADNAFYFASFVLMSIFGVLMPFVWVLRYRHYNRQFDMTVYQKRLRVGWPLTGVGGELIIISILIGMAYLQQWPPLHQNTWFTLVVIIGSLGFLCFFVGQVVLAEGFQYLRATRSRHGRHSPTNN